MTMLVGDIVAGVEPIGRRGAVGSSMTDALVARAGRGDDGAFAELVEGHRAELRVHCYRLLGAVPAAELALGESLAAAWRALPAFDGTVPVRGWLHRVATEVCLSTLRTAPPPLEPPNPPFRPPEPTRTVEPQWFGPFPDALLVGVPDDTPGPDARYTAAESLELAFVAALQRLTPRQRAVAVLRDVLGFPLADVAAMLAGPPDAVEEDVAAARTVLDARGPRHSPSRSDERQLARRFARAFAADDVDGVVALLTEDAWLTMQPSPLLYEGGSAIARYLRVSAAFRGGRRFSLVPTRANRQPAFGLATAEPIASRQPWAGIIVLTVQGRRISALTRFLDPGLGELFGLTG
jgi:RNA polymerase sigma-70 factor (TIGR02960 family)